MVGASVVVDYLYSFSEADLKHPGEIVQVAVSLESR
jgi:hypothetical protein